MAPGMSAPPMGAMTMAEESGVGRRGARGGQLRKSGKEPNFLPKTAAEGVLSQLSKMVA